jgi:hypothetical protein
LVEAGLIHIYEANGQLWLQWPGLADNQPGLRADRETPEYHAPADCQHAAGIAREDSRESPESPGNSPADAANGRRASKDEEKTSEREGEDEDNRSEGEDEGTAIDITSTDTISQVSSLFGNARITSHQASRLRSIHTKYPDTFTAALEWAAAEGMTLGEAIVAITKALPNWSRAKGAGNGTWYTKEEYEKYFYHPHEEDP